MTAALLYNSRTKSPIDLWGLVSAHFAGLLNSANLARDKCVTTAAPFPRPPVIFSPFTNTIELIGFALCERFGIVQPTAYRMVALFAMRGAARSLSDLGNRSEEKAF